ncbi:MAG TPA: hypothetical protein VH163_06640, partial [Gemmatimonadales bacterium]|nr:hypothetical protein [Gemmatimonadales bacterium]
MRQLRILASSVASAAALVGAVLLAPASSAGIVAIGRSSSPASCPTPKGSVATRAAGIHWASSAVCAPGATAGTVAAPPGAVGASAPNPPYHNFPPLSFFGGKVAGVAGSPGDLTVTPVYWVPAGAGFKIPTAYESLINRFIVDLSMDHAAVNNVFAALT